MTDLKIIRDDAAHAAALAEIDVLWSGKAPDEVERLEILAVLVEDYERKRWPWPEIEMSVPELLTLVMREDGRTQSDLAKVLGSRARASEILSGKRGLSLDMVRALSEEWRIPVELLVGKRRASAA